MQLGLFPGRPSSLKGEEAPRLKATITLSIVDKVTGECMKRSIPFQGDETTDLVEWITSALKHQRSVNDVKSFVAERDG